MPKNRIVGAQPPPRHPVPTYQVLRPQKHGPLDVTLLADTVSGILVHWVTSDEGGVGCSLPCWQHEADCPYHDDPIEWTGWLPVWDHVRGKRAILRLGPKDERELSRVLGLDVDWRHVRVKLTPTNAGEGRTIHVERVTEHMPAAQIGPHSMERTICLVLRCDHVPRQSPPDPEPDPEVRGL